MTVAVAFGPYRRYVPGAAVWGAAREHSGVPYIRAGDGRTRRINDAFSKFAHGFAVIDYASVTDASVRSKITRE